MASELFRVATFWMGRRLSVIEIASLLSFQRAGHRVVVFGYVRPDGIPEGIEWCNAEEILPRTEFLFAPNGSPALGTDLFRYRLQVHGHGLWLDADILLLKPLEKLTTPVYGWQDELRMNAAVLYLPPDSAVLQDLIT